MKTKFNFRKQWIMLSLLSVIGLGIYGCQEEKNVNEQSLRIFNEVNSDEISIELFQDYLFMMNEIKDAIQQKGLTSEQIGKASSTEELNDLLGLHSGQIHEMYDNILEKNVMLIEKYNLYSYSDIELNEVFSNSNYETIRSQFEVYSTPRVKTRNESNNSTDPCQEAFEEAFREIHNDFDRRVKQCLIMLLTPAGVGGAVACESWNIYNTAMAIAKATDKFNSCK